MNRFPWCLLIGLFLSIARPAVSQSRPVAKTPPPGKASLDGLILDAATRQPIGGATIMAYDEKGRNVQSKFAAQDGSFRIELNPREQSRVVTQAKGYIPTEERIDYTEGRATSRFGKIILLTRAIIPPPTGVASGPIKTAEAPTPTPPKVAAAPATKPPVVTPPKPPLTITDRPVELRAIQFNQSTAEMLPEAKSDLDRVLVFMSQNPGIVIELAGHTDNQGDFDQNVTLSRQRAETVKAYLVGKGIAANRIQTRGYGGTRPVATNNDERRRQLNRRVEMTIVKQ
ncbi:OmpA family protein [Fibrella aquatilis]|uniref:OmpA family protein n=1 Tax=Fibrella aquatilis TaxID=2817059 RepID=A0A939G2U6_9BACT|nr:OmpA family protein [Fibrella aquatilis]MBO0930163.1 OmpA family protein [Fibrella aquatilis]